MEHLSLLRCPSCRGELAAEPHALHCTACHATYPLIHGIPDFRPEPADHPRYSDVCERVIERWPHDSYRELWTACHPAHTDALRRLWIHHEEQAPQRGERRWHEIQAFAHAARLTLTTDGTALDLGCGLGSAIFALARRARLAVGLDILMTDLLLAKKRFAEAGITNAAFVCASAVDLPFADDAFDLLNATDVVEHMPDQPKFLAEGRRVMRPDGVFFFNSPNRFSLLTPEPHVRLWGVGWLPRPWMEPYVRWRIGKSYRGKRLLSLFELRRMLRTACGPHFAVRALIPRPGLAHAALRPLETLARPLLPQHNVLAWKPPA